MEKFSPVGEKDVTRAIVHEFTKQFEEYVESDCIIIGAGPSGLMAGRNLAKAGKNWMSLVSRTKRLAKVYSLLMDLMPVQNLLPQPVIVELSLPI